MKKITLIAVMLFAMNGLFAQAQKQLNIGLIGVSFEIPVANDITIAPTAFTNFNFDYITLGAEANYYFDRLFGLPDAWDIYGGANIGFGIAMNDGGTSGLDLGLQVGTRWFWNDKWGVYLEIGGGKLNGAIPALGITMKL